MKKIGRVLDVRWVASSHRTFRAIWTMHRALYSNVQNARQDKEHTANERVMFQGLSNKLSSGEFVHGTKA